MLFLVYTYYPKKENGCCCPRMNFCHNDEHCVMIWIGSETVCNIHCTWAPDLAVTFVNKTVVALINC